MMNRLMSRVVKDIVDEALRSEYNCFNGYVEFQFMHEHWQDKTYHIGVNWAAAGTQTDVDTIKFARRLQDAAYMAAAINGLNLVWDLHKADDKITTEEQYQEELEKLTSYVKANDYTALQCWLFDHTTEED